MQIKLNFKSRINKNTRIVCDWLVYTHQDEGGMIVENLSLLLIKTNVNPGLKFSIKLLESHWHGLDRVGL